MKSSFANVVAWLISEEVSGESNRIITCHDRNVLFPLLPVYKHPETTYVGEERT